MKTKSIKRAKRVKPKELTAKQIVDSLFSYIDRMGRGQDSVSEDEWLSNVWQQQDGIVFDGHSSSCYINRDNLEKWVTEKLNLPSVESQKSKLKTKNAI